MSRSLVRPQFPLPPVEYNQGYMTEIVRQFSVFIQQIQNPGDGRFTTVVITNMPDNDVGLEQGSLYEHGGYVMISELNRSAVSGSSMTSTAGNVTVSTP
mgnify:CR=1 FL=1